MTRRPALSAFMLPLVASTLVLAQPASQVLELWGDASPPPGTVTSLDLQGVVVVMGDGTSRLVDWTRVRDVRGARAEQFELLRDDARALWRASVRLDRGDLVNAEPLLEGLFTTYGPESGASSSIVARGLLRCRLATGARAPAIAPWLGVLRAEGWAPGGTMDQTPGVTIDPETGLCPALAPVWFDDGQSAWLAQNGSDPLPLRGARAGSERMRLAALSTMYHLSARFEQDPDDRETIGRELAALLDEIDAETMREPGIALVHEIVLSRVGDASQRAGARAALDARLRRRPPDWVECWIRVAIGRSLILEPEPEVRRRGVIQLLHVPARYGERRAGLSSIALAHAAATMRSLGDDASARTLRRELLDRYPGSEGARWHAVTDWAPRPGVSRIAPTDPTTTRPASMTEGNDRS